MILGRSQGEKKNEKIEQRGKIQKSKTVERIRVEAKTIKKCYATENPILEVLANMSLPYRNKVERDKKSDKK